MNNPTDAFSQMKDAPPAEPTLNVVHDLIAALRGELQLAVEFVRYIRLATADDLWQYVTGRDFMLKDFVDYATHALTISQTLSHGVATLRTLETIRIAAQALSDDLEDWRRLSPGEQKAMPINPHATNIRRLREALAAYPKEPV